MPSHLNSHLHRHSLASSSPYSPSSSNSPSSSSNSSSSSSSCCCCFDGGGLEFWPACLLGFARRGGRMHNLCGKLCLLQLSCCGHACHLTAGCRRLLSAEQPCHALGVLGQPAWPVWQDAAALMPSLLRVCQTLNTATLPGQDSLLGLLAWPQLQLTRPNCLKVLLRPDSIDHSSPHQQC